MKSKRKRVTILIVFLMICLLLNATYLLNLWYNTYDWIIFPVSMLISFTNVMEAVDGLVYDKSNTKNYWIYTGISAGVLLMNCLTCHKIFTELLFSA